MRLGNRRIRVSRVELSTFYHSTEDPNKVRKALLNLIPERLRSEAVIKEVITHGHYGNIIGVLRVELSGGDASETLKHIICSLSSIDRKILIATLSNRVGHRPSHLYIRVSKQDAFMGRVELMDGDDVVRIVVTVNGILKIGDLKEFLSRVMGECIEVRRHSPELQ